MNIPRTPKLKRSDIQGLRAIAIFGVLLFHLAPKRFINGFLGVDAFFVLSGYLMSSILSRESSIDATVVKMFYIRRFKRIVPLYSIMLVALALITPIVFLPSDISHFITDIEWALPFAENMQNVLKKYDYWDEVFNSPVLLHAWSLGVELQYYLIVPFIMIVARFGQTRRFRIMSFLLISAGSFLIHICSPTTVSFGLLFARVWQFLVGSIFFELEGALDEPASVQYQSFPLRAIDQEKLLDEDDNENEDIEIGKHQNTRHSRWSSCSHTSLISFISYCVTLYLLWMVIMSISGPLVSRIFVTFATGHLLLIGKYVQNRILSNEIMVYIGDLSYLIYLAHWPVIVLYKYYKDLSDLTIQDMSFCLLSTLIISVLLHHSLESLFITSSTILSLLFVAVVYGMIVVGLLMGGMQQLSEYAHPLGEQGMTTGQNVLATSTTRWNTDPSQTNGTTTATIITTTAKKVVFNRQEAVQWNQAQSKIVYFRNPDGCVRDFEAERWTRFTEEASLRCVSTGNGTAKVLVMGNSYGYRAFPVLHRLFSGRYAQMRMFTRSSRVYLTKDPESTRFADMEKIVLEKFQPDITFLIEKDSFKTLLNPIVGNEEDDPITKHVQAAIDVLSNNSGTVVVDQQYIKPDFKDGVAYIIQKRLQQGKTAFDDLRMSRKDYEAIHSNEIRRMATIKNENVIVNKVEEQLCPGEYCYFFNQDSLHSYYGDNAAHLTSEGLKLLEPNYNEIIEDFMIRLQSKKNEA